MKKTLTGDTLYSIINSLECGIIDESEAKVQFLRSNIDLEVFELPEPKVGSSDNIEYYTLRPCGIQALEMGGNTDKKTLTLAWCVCSNPDEVMIRTLDAWLTGLGIYEE